MIEIKKSNLNFRTNCTKRDISKINKIILHHSGVEVLQNIETIHNYHLSKGWAGIGYHYYIRKDGSVYEGRAIDIVGAHCSNFNTDSIGICCEGNFDNETMNDKQKEALKILVKYLYQKYNIKTIAGHRNFNKTSCPGKNFPMQDVLNYIEEKEPEIDINYEVGKVYTTQVDLNVRTMPDVNSRQKLYKELTQDGKKHSYKQTKAVLKKGTRVSCLGIYKMNNNIWIKIPSGFIAGLYNGKIYIK